MGGPRTSQAPCSSTRSRCQSDVYICVTWLAYRWYGWALATALSFFGGGWVGEILNCCREDLLLPLDLAEDGYVDMFLSSCVCVSSIANSGVLLMCNTWRFRIPPRASFCIWFSVIWIRQQPCLTPTPVVRDSWVRRPDARWTSWWVCFDGVQNRQICTRHHVVHAIAIAGDAGVLLAGDCFPYCAGWSAIKNS